MTISTITIATVDYTAYASVAQADPYLAVDPIRAVAWAALTADQKGANLVVATRLLDQLMWSGEKTGDYDTQANQFPRTGVVYKDNTAVSTSEVPQQVEDACILIAGSIAVKPASGTNSTSGSNIKNAKAGTASVTFFRPSDGTPLADQDAFKLIACMLTSASGLLGLASGADQTSSFCDVSPYGVTDPYA